MANVTHLVADISIKNAATTLVPAMVRLVEDERDAQSIQRILHAAKCNGPNLVEEVSEA